MAYLHRFLLSVAALVFALFAAGCSSEREQSHANLVEIEPAPRVSTGLQDQPSTDRVALAANEPAAPAAQPLAPFTEDDVFEAINNFVDRRDAIVVGTTVLSALDGTVAESVIAQVDSQRANNLANIENYSTDARVSYTTFPYLLNVERSGDQIAAVVCAERWGERSTGKQQVVFMDQAMVFNVIDDRLELADVQTAHDGERTTEGLTCLTRVMSERAVDATRAGVVALEAINDDPGRAVETNYETLFAAVAYDSFSQLPATVDPSRRRVSPVEVRYRPLGMDASKGVDFIGAVSVCRHYPEGVWDEVVATGERVQVNQAYTPGTSVEDIVYVHIEPARRSDGAVDRFWDFAADVSRDCWS